MSEEFLRDPIRILVESNSLTLNGIIQYQVDVGRDDYDDTKKFATLMDLYQNMSISQAIIYCNVRRKVDLLADRLEQDGFIKVSRFHADMDSNQRKNIMNSFRAGKTRILISTDLLARGIDVQQVSLVINFDIPGNTESYLHRIGRSGRYGRKGVAINLISERDMRKVGTSESHYGIRFSHLPADLKNI